jgi:hypothetical protein
VGEFYARRGPTDEARFIINPTPKVEMELLYTVGDTHWYATSGFTQSDGRHIMEVGVRYTSTGVVLMAVRGRVRIGGNHVRDLWSFNPDDMDGASYTEPYFGTYTGPLTSEGCLEVTDSLLFDPAGIYVGTTLGGDDVFSHILNVGLYKN